jgi:hypothetical protein
MKPTYKLQTLVSTGTEVGTIVGIQITPAGISYALNTGTTVLEAEIVAQYRQVTKRTKKTTTAKGLSKKTKTVAAEAKHA